ncbi:MAG: single-stranded-DNA-specific exonuclease RecJ [Epsilonproteobacteria bacterium]|nr:single-stranded-DNA-specific exonuclease RecJ [Campylobacterota bacterium]
MLTKQKIKELLAQNLVELSPNEIPHFDKFKNISIATQRIVDAINNHEKIVVVGDYDVDGVSASAIMYKFFAKFYPIEVVIPNRFEDGYGISPGLLDKIQADLVITVDNGISSYDAATYCQKRGIDLIITDHHTPKYPLPDAYAIINPKQKDDNFPYKEICGAQIAWYLCGAINKALQLQIDLREFLDYLVLAIIADVMPLNHLNRVLVKMGLARLSKSTKPFAMVLREFFNKQYFKSEDIAFAIAPRLNSAGRMADAMVAFRFLISDDMAQARMYFEQLNNTNSQRKAIQEEITQQCIQAKKHDHFIVVSGDFHEGIVGIVASKLVHHYKLPAIVFTKKDGTLKGSGRSLGDVDLYDLISQCDEYLEKFGGHKLACGLSIKEEDLSQFSNKINDLASRLPREYFYLDEFVLGELPLSECDMELIEILESFEPFGEGNPRPKFSANVNIENVHHLKDNHYKLIVSQDGVYKDGIIFNYTGEFYDRCNIIFSVNKNEYNSTVNVQLMITDIQRI